MNADAFRQLYAYHFAQNRQLWDAHLAALTPQQFTQDTGYSVGSLRNHTVHLMSVDDTWFSGLRGVDLPEPLTPADFPDQAAVRAYWDGVEARMHAYLSGLRDDMLFTTPLEDEDDALTVWQVLLHVANHGTDHRAQMLRVLHDLGHKTGPQDLVFYLYDHP